MADKDSVHDPSKYRALLREAKRGHGRHPTKLLDEARQLKDPYFASLAIFELSTDPRLEMKKAVSAANEALMTAGRVKRLWRRAELLATIAKKGSSWRDEGAGQARKSLLDGVLSAILSMPHGKGLSDAITECSPYLDCESMGLLLTKAVKNKGFEAIDSKAAIRQWAQRCKGAGPTLDEMLDTLMKVDDRGVRSRLMGYLHLQCKRSGLLLGTKSPLQIAVETGLTLGKEERLEALQYLARQAFNKEDFKILARALDRLEDPANRARLLATLGGSADKAGLREMALSWFREGLHVCSLIENTQNRASIRLNLAKGLGRCGESELARETYQAAADDCGNNIKLLNTIYRSIEKQGIKPLKPRKTKELDLKEISKANEAEQVGGANNVLAIYDTYEGGLKPVHLRAVARAAPLCTAFGLDLALMGFPTDDLDDLISQVITETNIGKGGKYLKELLAQGRVVLVPCTQHEPPRDWRNLGMPVATTSHPERDKKIEMKKAIQLAKSTHPLQRACLIMGLGKRGLPPSLLKAVPYHLELTGSAVPLETCTAMGVIAQQLWEARE